MSVEPNFYKKYLPILKWRQGEYQALFRLDKDIKNNLYPLFVIPPIEFDFEEQKPKKTADKHVEKIADRLYGKWGRLPALVDIDSSLHVEIVSGGRSVPEFIFDELDSKGIVFSPVIQLEYSADYIAAAKASWLSTNNGICLRVQLDLLADLDNVDAIQDLIALLECPESYIDLVIDFRKGATYEPIEDLVTVTSALLSNIPNLVHYRSLYIAGTSLDLGQVKKPGAQQIRQDWLFYQSLHSALKNDFKNLGFGDYTIETPEFSSVDMRMMRPAAKLVYSYENEWVILKGTSFRNNTSQMVDLCYQLISSHYYYGNSFSQGDQKIYDCAHQNCSTGNLSTWKETAVSHHLSLVVKQNAKLYGL